MPSTARAFWVTPPGQGRIESARLNPAGPEEVLVKTRFSAVSRGTEALVFHGRVPASQAQRMRAPFQEGDLPGPVKYGYASVGEVRDGAPELLGQTVFCLYPHQDQYIVPASAVVPVPDTVPAARAVLAANTETALNVIWDAEVSLGDRVCIVGGGVVGCLITWLAARIPGTTVTLVDIETDRARLAELLGAEFRTPDQAPAEQDVVIHTSASEDGLATALGCAGDEARVVEASWYGERRPQVPLGEAFHSRRLQLRSSQVGQLPTGRRPRWDYRRRMTQALALLVDARVDALFSGECAFEQLPAVLPEVLADDSRALCQRVVY